MVRGLLIASIQPLALAAPQPAGARAPAARSAGGANDTGLATGLTTGFAVIMLLASGAAAEVRARRRALRPATGS